MSFYKRNEGYNFALKKCDLKLLDIMKRISLNLPVNFIYILTSRVGIEPGLEF